MITPRLEQLIDDFRKIPGRSWIQEVLLACLERLGSGAHGMEDRRGLCCVDRRRCPVHRVHVPLGSCRRVDPGTEHPADADPTACGEAIADFDVAEPLGTHADDLTYDHDGTGWWGDPIPGSILEGRGQAHP